MDPVLVPTSGYCEYECRRCTQVCPTRALARLTLEEKKQFKIGTAVIDRSACYTYADGYNCAVCEEHCPVPEKPSVSAMSRCTIFAAGSGKSGRSTSFPTCASAAASARAFARAAIIPAIRVGAEEEQREIPYG